MRLFHVTHLDTLPNIRREGLRPLLGPRSLLCGERTPMVFCFHSLIGCHDALLNWMGDCFEEHDPLVILEIDVTGLDVHCDHGSFETQISTTVPYDRVRALHTEDGRTLDPHQEITHETLRCRSVVTARPECAGVSH